MYWEFFNSVRIVLVFSHEISGLLPDGKAERVGVFRLRYNVETVRVPMLFLTVFGPERRRVWDACSISLTMIFASEFELGVGLRHHVLSAKRHHQTNLGSLMKAQTIEENAFLWVFALVTPPKVIMPL